MGLTTVWVMVAACLGSAPPASVEACSTRPAQDVQASAAPSVPQEAAQDDAVLNPGQPEFTVVNLPTTLRVPARRFAFRVSHRFGRDLTEGDFGDLVEDLFGLDAGALVGLELRYGLMPGWQAGVFRTSDRTIQLFTQVNVASQERAGLNVDALAALEGTNNLRGSDPFSPTGDAMRSPTLGVVASRVFGRTAALNATVAWIGNTNPLPSDDDHTVLAAIGGRLRVRPTVYLVAEVAPRIAGFTPGTTSASFGIEKRVGGHAFQLNVSNSVASTLGQIARGAGSSDAWYIGFNINRKFF